MQRWNLPARDMRGAFSRNISSIIFLPSTYAISRLILLCPHPFLRVRRQSSHRNRSYALALFLRAFA